MTDERDKPGKGVLKFNLTRHVQEMNKDTLPASELKKMELSPEFKGHIYLPTDEPIPDPLDVKLPDGTTTTLPAGTTFHSMCGLAVVGYEKETKHGEYGSLPLLKLSSRRFWSKEKRDTNAY